VEKQSRIKTTQEKLTLFKNTFGGLSHVYGTYDPETGRSWQVKEPVTNNVIFRHLSGIQPFGVYLLRGTTTEAIAVDFDDDDLELPLEFTASAGNYGIPAYIEQSKSKGYHVWIFFEKRGVVAEKARRVVATVLEEIGKPGTEIFPKQDRIGSGTSYGNFINAPLFGRLVPRGCTCFLSPLDPTKPAEDQWEVLENIQRISRAKLNEIIAINDIPQRYHVAERKEKPVSKAEGFRTFGLMPCAQRMLTGGVKNYQRLACFRLAVQLKKTGLPQELTEQILCAWADKNRPQNGKRIITPDEIISQTSWAYTHNYRGCGCEDISVKPYCKNRCPLKKRFTQKDKENGNKKNKSQR